VLAGDGRAERALYDAHVDRVYRLCYRLASGDEPRAQDFTQETFVRAFDRLAEFRGDAALATWLHGSAARGRVNRAGDVGIAPPRPFSRLGRIWRRSATSVCHRRFRHGPPGQL
jgi:hypothetical protein